MGIDITITAGPDSNTSHVSATGSVQHVITDKERGTFGLSDSALKSAVASYFGKAPNDAYLRSPTPWGDLYKTYSWPQVQTILNVESSEILGITSEPVIVKTQEFVNNSSKTGIFDVAISDQVENTASNQWSTGGELSIEEKISYSIDFIGEAKGEVSLKYSQSWGIGGSHSSSVTVGSTSGVTVELEPGESVVAELSASRGVMKVRLRYNAYLTGYVAVNYDPTYKDHHFWALPVGDVMKSGGIPNSVKSTEDIEVGYYSNSKIVLRDKSSGVQKATYFLT